MTGAPSAPPSVCGVRRADGGSRDATHRATARPASSTGAGRLAAGADPMTPNSEWVPSGGGGGSSTPRLLARELNRCSFGLSRGLKRFVNTIASQPLDAPLTPRQEAYLWAIAWSWRGQLPRKWIGVVEGRTGGVGLRRR